MVGTKTVEAINVGGKHPVVQLDDPVEEHVEGGQLEHDVAPWVGENVPAPHGEHNEAPGNELKLALHTEGNDAPPLQLKPAGQATGAVQPSGQ